MNRNALIWFAAGATTSAVATVVTASLKSEPANTIPHLRLHEPDSAASEEKYDEIASYTGQMLRECGAHSFEVTAWDIDIPSYAYLPLTESNSKAVPCVIKQASNQHFDVDLVFQLDKNAQTH